MVRVVPFTILDIWLYGVHITFLYVISFRSLRSCVIKLPKCRIWLFHRIGSPFIVTDLRGAVPSPPTRIQKLFFSLNMTWYSLAKFSQIVIKSWRAPTDGASRLTSSAYPKHAYDKWPKWHPIPEERRRFNNSSMYTLKRIGDKMPPCLTPFSVEKNSDLTPFHVVHMRWRVYMSSNSSIFPSFCSMLTFQKTHLIFTLYWGPCGIPCWLSRRLILYSLCIEGLVVSPAIKFDCTHFRLLNGLLLSVSLISWLSLMPNPSPPAAEDIAT